MAAEVVAVGGDQIGWVCPGCAASALEHPTVSDLLFVTRGAKGHNARKHEGVAVRVSDAAVRAVTENVKALGGVVIDAVPTEAAEIEWPSRVIEGAWPLY